MSKKHITNVKRCTNSKCTSIYLDRRYGKGRRPMNQMSNKSYRCPVCGSIKAA